VRTINGLRPAHFDLDLGDGHWLRWSEYEGERCGAIIMHVTMNPLRAAEFCEVGFTIRGTRFNKLYAERPAWDLSGSFEEPTLSPAFRCHCGDSGRIEHGTWIRV